MLFWWPSWIWHQDDPQTWFNTRKGFVALKISGIRGITLVSVLHWSKSRNSTNPRCYFIFIYNNPELPEYLEYGFSLGYTPGHTPVSSPMNHSSALCYPSHVNHYTLQRNPMPMPFVVPSPILHSNHRFKLTHWWQHPRNTTKCIESSWTCPTLKVLLLITAYLEIHFWMCHEKSTCPAPRTYGP